jgi:hypothetical protein
MATLNSHDIMSMHDARSKEELEVMIEKIALQIIEQKARFSDALWSDGKGCGGSLKIDFQFDEPLHIKFETGIYTTHNKGDKK